MCQKNLAAGNDKITTNVCVSVCVCLTWFVLSGEALDHKLGDVFLTAVG